MTAIDNYSAIKVCTRCKIGKAATLEFFHAHKRSADGVRAVCKVCRAKINIENGEEVKRKKREHYAANRNRIIENQRRYYLENLEKQRKAGLNRHYKNRELRLCQMREYRIENREALLARQRASNKKQYAEQYRQDLKFTLTHRLRALVRVSLKENRKSKRLVELLGFSVDELRSHLERQFTKGMDWSGYLSGKIHVDHIVPISNFDITSADCEEFKACWSLSNLRPMWASENWSKSDKRTVLV
ncbi:hypothetical protein UFOVP814_28 [uncultured Caudovirales phage]|uniref:HNHc domain containing protein n=1 Tax=uncultured Caudovirales phage TaxID=2100421 RepID=A0A6J5NVD5_9CAUD|nr:hypothetical protein UFOVP814_28 [uncultured Caudovirales phage]